MKILVVPDDTGNITSFAVPNPQFPAVIGFIAANGRMAVEVEFFGLEALYGDAGSSERLFERLQEFRVDQSDGKPKLVAK